MNRRTFFVGAGGALLLAGGTTAWMSSVGSMADYQAYAKRLRADLTMPPNLGGLIRHATLAANSHNTQPWRFHVGDGFIDILPDISRRTPAVDPDDHHLFVSLGCAAENLAISAAATGWPGEVQMVPGGDGARYAFVHGSTRASSLHAAIAKRQSTRAEYDRHPVPVVDLTFLEQAAATPGVHLTLITDRMRIDKVRDLVVAANDVQMADSAFMNELEQWIRFNPRSAMSSGDGLFSAASGNPVLPSALGRFAFERFFNARTERDKYARQIDSSAGIAVFVGDREDNEHWVRVGRACQRFALTATNLGIKVAFVNQPVEVARFRPLLAGIVGDTGRRRPDIVMRFGYGPTLPFSPRRRVEAVLV
ncbi:Tat pathway signal protein [Burkholderia sp. MSMB0856]|uniref:Acg family FMN-binding oxidoreductase n=1 Tax=Burkholderia sp. MSMB0856 TaxID=1637869 RepID=UPI00075331B5|nr:Tat pathway signal protein [Burkholderia sp. MSMB0856]AOJ91124.1 Tat pathway signal protein [Burkholderia sp. MSMB0856]KVH39566.1 Tat pathway signal protein [Burkholderia sp. MSMB0856]